MTQTTVPTDCDFTISIYCSGEPWYVEEWAPVVEAARKVVDEMVAKLRPVLKYACVETAYVDKSPSKVVKICSDASGGLFLQKDGVFCVGQSDESLTISVDAWEQFSFARVVEGLAQRFAEAENAKATHLAAICRRREMLDRMLEAMQSKD
jgi:hypothetical protein